VDSGIMGATVFKKDSDFGFDYFDCFEWAWQLSWPYPPAKFMGSFHPSRKGVFRCLAPPLAYFFQPCYLLHPGIVHYYSVTYTLAYSFISQSVTLRHPILGVGLYYYD
jgi:hypothetical protein